jgi:hypothetical protein
VASRGAAITFICAAAVMGATQLVPSAIAGAKRPSERNRMIWDAEFNRAAGRRPTSWTLGVGGGPGQQLEYYTARGANASLDGRGHLEVRARRHPLVAHGHAYRYTSANLETLGRFQFKYGRVEARIDVPAGRGLWPAFFMLGADYPRVGWPDSGELDVMEIQGNNTKTLVATAHGPASYSAQGWQINAFFHSRVPLSDAFHVYGLDWSPNKIVWTIDGHEYGQMTRGELGAGEQWVFDRPFFLLLNLSVGGTWVGPPTSSTRFPATMRVDWVRVYS